MQFSVPKPFWYRGMPSPPTVNTHICHVSSGSPYLNTSMARVTPWKIAIACIVLSRRLEHSPERSSVKLNPGVRARKRHRTLSKEIFASCSQRGAQEGLWRCAIRECTGAIYWNCAAGRSSWISRTTATHQLGWQHAWLIVVLAIVFSTTDIYLVRLVAIACGSLGVGFRPCRNLSTRRGASPTASPTGNVFVRQLYCPLSGEKWTMCRSGATFKALCGVIHIAIRCGPLFVAALLYDHESCGFAAVGHGTKTRVDSTGVPFTPHIDWGNKPLDMISQRHT